MEPRLDLTRDFEFALGLAFGFELLTSARRRVATPSVSSSKPVRPNEFPSGSSNREKIPPHCGLFGGDSKRTPRLPHYLYLASISSVMK
jgi:hypothetical protein